MDTIDCPKCEHEHEPHGSEEDSGAMKCESCGFKFIVEIEYDPSYYTTCVTHEWGEVKTIDGGPAHRHCNLCMRCEFVELPPTADTQ